MAAPGRKFSWMRLINNAEPNFALDRKDDVNLSSAQADALVEYQLKQEFPRYLDEKSFLVADLVDHISISKQVYHALLKYGFIANAPICGIDDNPALPTVNTNIVTKQFAHQLYMISVHAQRKLVGLLFFWEEECTRWRLLAQEEQEILKAMDIEGQDNSDLQVALAAVEMKKKLLPSQRAEGTANVGPGSGHVLPGY